MADPSREANPDNIMVHKLILPDGITVHHAMMLLDNRVSEEIHLYVKKHTLGGTEEHYEMKIGNKVLNPVDIVETYAKDIRSTGTVTIVRKSDNSEETHVKKPF